VLAGQDLERSEAEAQAQAQMAAQAEAHRISQAATMEQLEIAEKALIRPSQKNWELLRVSIVNLISFFIVSIGVSFYVVTAIARAQQDAIANKPENNPVNATISKPKNLFGYYWSMNWNNNGQVLATRSDGIVKLLTRPGALKISNLREGVASSISWSPDGKILATGEEDGTVKLQTRTGELLKTLNMHKNSVSSLSWSPDGKTLATGGDDGIVKLQTRAGELLKTLNTNQASVRSLSWSPDGKNLATGGGDGSVKLWTSTGELVEDLKAQ
jgi:WD40 repeat protein